MMRMRLSSCPLYTAAFARRLCPMIIWQSVVQVDAGGALEFLESLFSLGDGRHAIREGIVND